MRTIYHPVIPLILGSFGFILFFNFGPGGVLPPVNLNIRSGLDLTSTFASGNISSIKGIVINRRAGYGQPAQKPLNGCPAMFDVPVLDCSLCGGESPTSPRTCSKPLSGGGWQCACNPTPPEPPTITTVITTVGDEIATGIFELETLTQYANLREHITIFTTASASPAPTDVATTTTDTESGAKTVAAVVLAGGFAWFLAESVGGPAAAAALKPPSDSTKKQDDESCPDPQSKCSECNGASGMCTTGTGSGCGCDTSDCPAEGAIDQPECSDDTGCAGIDGKCTKGEHEGCDCKESECPDPEKEQFRCGQCGGMDEQGKCKGDPEYDYEFKGCDCLEDLDFSQETPRQVRPYFGIGIAKMARVPDFQYAPAGPAQPEPTQQCDSHKSSRVPWNVFTSGVYTNFCNSLNVGSKAIAFAQTVDVYGKVIPTVKTRKREMLKRAPPNPKAYETFKFDLNWSGGDGSCPSDCSNSFYTIADGICGHTAGLRTIMATEASLDTGCGIFSYKITSPPEPSTEPTTVERTRTDEWLCSNPDLTFNRKFSLSNAEKAVGKFCTGDIVLPDVALPVSYTYALKDMDIYMQIGWRREGQDGCGSITNPDQSRQNIMNKDQCSEYLLKAVNSCDTNTRKDKHGGTYMWSSPIGCIDFTVLGVDN